MYPFSLFLGLVIVDARYGPKAYDDETAEGLDVDVTVPLQALVNNSQLCVPGGRSKVSVLEPRFCSVSLFLCFSPRARGDLSKERGPWGSLLTDF